MYTDAARTPGPHRRHPLRDAAAPCHWDHHHPHHPQPCDWHELWLPHHHHQQYYGGGGGGGPGCYHPASVGARGGDHPSSLDLHRGEYVWSPSHRDAEGGGRVAHRNPQRRPVFAGQPAPPGVRSQHSYPSWDTDPAQWRCPPPPEPAGFRHYPPVREQCGCVVRGDVPGGAARPFDTRPSPQQQQPHPPPQFRGHRRRRIVKYVSRFEEEEEEVEEEEDEGRGHDSDCCRLEERLAHAAADHRVHAAVPNGHYGPRPAYYDGWDGDSHQDWGRWKGGSEECCNGHGNGGGSRGPHRGFFSTEVPQIHMDRSRRRKGIYVPAPPESTNQDPLKQPNTADNGDCRLNSHRHHTDTDPVGKPRGKQDSVRDQIRQVVTDLEDVLGGLKQVHVEMKEVVEQIDRLTVNMDLSEDVPSITQGVHGISHPGPLNIANMALVAGHDPASPPPQASQLQHRHHAADHVVLRTNSPSPVHMASVVKTSRVAQQQQHGKDPKPRANGHPPHLYPPRDSNHVQGPPHPPPPPPPQSLDPTVVIGRSTAGSKTQKPPPYPQNGRCGKGPPVCQPPVPLKMNPPHPRRGRQSTSMV